MSPPPANASGLPHQHVRRQTRPDGPALARNPDTLPRPLRGTRPWSPTVPRRTGPARHCNRLKPIVALPTVSYRPSLADRLSQLFQPISGNAGRVMDRATLAQITPELTPPTRTSRTAEECGRSAAWPGRSARFPGALAAGHRGDREARRFCGQRDPLRVAALSVDSLPGARLYKPIRRAVRFRRDVAPAKHLTDIR